MILMQHTHSRQGLADAGALYRLQGSSMGVMMHTRWGRDHQAADPDWTARGVACLAGAVVWLQDMPPS